MSDNNNNNQNSRIGRYHDDDGELMTTGGPRRPLWRTILYWALGIIFAIILAGGGLFAVYAASAPKITTAQLTSQNSTEILDDKGNVISSLGSQNRTYVKSDQIPKELKQSVVSIEDRRFYKHHFGIDPLRIVSAAAANFTGSSLGLQGGSTLTQQLVKLSVFSTAASDRTLKRKSQEAALAYYVEKHYSKDQILEFYINKVYMGNGVYGMGTASKYYYNKPLSKLNYAQFAVLAGMPQSPTYYDPVAHPNYAKQRRDTVLRAMYENKVISKADMNSGIASPVSTGLSVNHSVNDTSSDNKVVDAYLQQTIKEVQKKGFNPYKDGIRIYTNLNMGAQQRLYDIVNSDKYVNFPSELLQVGVTMTDPQTGAVTAMIGGRKQNVAFGLNRATQTDRSSGSTIKPFMDYGPAIEYNQWPTFKALEDTKYTYPGTNIELNDWDGKYQGTLSMRKALVESRNIPAIRTLQEVGINRATQFMAQNGMKFKEPLVYSNGIGVYVSSMQESAAFGALANGGTYHTPHLVKKVVTQDGETHKFDVSSHRSMSPATAYMLTDMLKGVPTDVWAPDAHIPGLHQAGKTGQSGYPDSVTTVPHTAVMDAWYTGYTQHSAISVWTGYDQPNEPGHYMTTAQLSIAESIYKYLASYMAQTQSNDDWEKPSNVESIKHNGIDELVISGSNWRKYLNDKDQSSPSGSSSSSVSFSSFSSQNSSSASSASSESQSAGRLSETGASQGAGNGGNTGTQSSTSTPAASSSSAAH
ncbi:transglycosylase domain-containing protein [Furfurilactobacillus siliginis]|uniref:Membrane carboxypeptidase (Penicillin-binding protein) n=1 Tax=Furfurilactobacillus siliginis TaxID=348151 RepID=A0A0R2L5B3_9LACO|nr:transglycosylase domain-containing protein [Furfurilactobacillus siliginis]KRN96953.1 membrane carboxypeptidase (penicillin-binding protein) [Furfurilactobacillus siliginis]GEK27712.1 penicillin-binding protein 1A [Furfurilactobacillus siliginis]